MLKRHAEYGCLSLVCRTADSRPSFHFFLAAKAPRNHSPARDAARLLPQHRRLRQMRWRDRALSAAGGASRSLSLTRTDAVAGLPGIYSEARGRKYFKGPQQPRLGDLADTELAIYGM